MSQHYRKFWLLPVVFLMIIGALPAAHADDVAPILPQFKAFNPPQDMVDLTFEDPEGKPHKLSDYHGQLILVNLWATWCPPCRAELPALDHLQTVFRGTAFHILPISMDDPKDADKITAFFHGHAIKSLPILKNPDMRQLAQLHPDGLPASYLMTPDGKVVGMVLGIASWDSEEAANLIEAYLPKPATPAKPK